MKLAHLRDVESNRFMPDAPEYIMVPENIGSVALRDWMDGAHNLKLHVFGHVHEQGMRVRTVDDKLFSNAALGMNVLTIEG